MIRNSLQEVPESMQTQSPESSWSFLGSRESNLVFIINELDKAASGKGNGNPADVLLTLLDNLGFTDNYMECMVPTVGVYPIATANDKSQISAPLMSRFAVIDIPGLYIRREEDHLLQIRSSESSDTHEPESRRMCSNRRRSGCHR